MPTGVAKNPVCGIPEISRSNETEGTRDELRNKPTQQTTLT